MDSGFQVLNSGFFASVIVSGIPNSLSCSLDSKAWDSGFLNPNSLT